MNIKEKIDKYINDRGLLKTPAHYVKELFNDIINKVYDVEQKPENIILFDTNKLNIDTKNGYYYNENLLSSIKITMAGDIIQPKVEFNGLSPKIELPKNITVNNKLINYNGIGKYVLSFNNNTCDIERYKCDFTKAPNGYIITTYYPEYLGDYPLSNNNYMFVSLDRDYTTAYGPVMENEKFITYVGTSIEPGLFANCALNSIEIPDSVKTIGEFAFAGSAITSVEIGNSVTSIGEGAFTYCTLLPSVEIPDSVTSIGEGAFCECSELTSITIPNSVTNIGAYAFADCYNLTSVVWNPINYSDFEMDENWEELSNPFYYSTGSITSFKFGDGVEHIPAFMCYGMYNLKSITIPNSVTSIGDDAFDSCSGLTSVVIPDSVTSIGIWAFYDCYNLKSITISNSVTSIGMGTFGYCSGLTSVVIPDSVTSIGEYAFESCSDLTSIVIPNSVAEIGRGAFYGTSWLQNQPDGCVYINNVLYVYKGEMSENTHIDVREGTTMISDEAFYDCSSLTSIAIPNSVNSIGACAFQYCNNLTTITIPDSVTYIGGGAFDGTPWFENQQDGCIYVNNILYTYKGEMSENTHIDVREGTTMISDEAFYDCSSLTSIAIPNSVNIIGEFVFLDCYGLNSITITAITPPIINQHSFEEIYSDYDVKIYVPDESVEAYKIAPNWSSYTSWIKPLSEKPV